MKPKKLTKKEIRELKEQFPINKQESKRLKENKRERLKNKLEMIAIVIGLVIVVGLLYLFYLVWNYKLIGIW